MSRERDLFRGTILATAEGIPAPPVSLGEQVRYLAGVLSSSAAADVERRLTIDAASRRQMMRTAVELAKVQALPWSVAIAKEDAISQEWVALARRQVEHLPSTAAWWKRPWDEARDLIAAGSESATAALGVLCSFGAQIAASGRVPASATFRSREDTPLVVGSASEGVRATVTAEIEAGGDLLGLLRLDGVSTPSASVRLDLLWGIHAWPVPLETSEAGTFAFHAAGFGLLARIPAGSLRSSWFRVTVGERPEASHAGRTTLLADCVDAEGNPEQLAPLPVELAESPRIEHEQFLVDVCLPPITRLMAAERTLAIDVVIAPDVWQRLGEWPVASFADEVRTLTADVPGLADMIVPFDSAIRAQLRLA